MSKKVELLKHYADYKYRYLKYYFPMIIEEVPIKEIKKQFNDEEKVTVQKNKVDNIIKDKLCEYLNTKFDIVKQNLLFLDNEYEKFGFDYELCDKMLWFVNYKWSKYDNEYLQLVDDFTISDSINLVKEFYNDLLKDNPNDVTAVNYIINNKINVVYTPDRAITDVSTSDINLTYTPDLSFLVVLAHEIAHAYAYYKTDNLMGSQDIRTVEIESSFIEKLFLKYLKEKQYPIIKDEKEIRGLNDKDLESYFISIFYSTLTYAFKIVDEKDFIDNLNEDRIINRDTFNDYLSYSPYEYNYIVQATFINDILDDYIYDDLKKIPIDEMKESLNEIGLYKHNEFGSFKFAVRYVGSYLLATYFDDIIDDEENVKNFIEFLNCKNDYSYADICNLIGLEVDDAITLPTVFMKKYLDIMNKDEIKVKRYPYITDEYVESDMNEYSKIIEKNKKSDRVEQEKMKLVRKMFHYYNSTKISTDLYPFNSISQLDDNEIDDLELVKKKLEKLL